MFPVLRAKEDLFNVAWLSLEKESHQLTFEPHFAALPLARYDGCCGYIG